MKRWLALFLLLAVGAHADSWLDARADYYVAARVKLGYATADSAPLTDTAGSLLFNEAATVILPLNRGIKKLTTIVTSYHENTYVLDSTLIDIDAVWFDSSGTVKPMKYIPVTSWAGQEHRDVEGTKSPTLTRPSYFDYTDSLLLIYPSPGHNRVDTMTIMGWHRLADVDTVTVSGSIDEEYRLAILYHMVWNHAKARSDVRAEGFKEELTLALNRVGLKLGRGDKIEKAGN